MSKIRVGAYPECCGAAIITGVSPDSSSYNYSSTLNKGSLTTTPLSLVVLSDGILEYLESEKVSFYRLNDELAIINNKLEFREELNINSLLTDGSYYL